MTTTVILDATYDEESLCDIERDVYEAISEAEVKEGTYRVLIVHREKNNE
jgi:hypothetical protein